MSYDRPDLVAKVAKKLEIGFPLLADPESAAIDAWGVRNPEGSGRLEGVARPVFFLVDGEGVVRGKLAHEGYKKRHAPGEVIAALRAIE